MQNATVYNNQSTGQVTGDTYKKSKLGVAAHEKGKRMELEDGKTSDTSTEAVDTTNSIRDVAANNDKMEWKDGRGVEQVEEGDYLDVRNRQTREIEPQVHKIRRV